MNEKIQNLIEELAKECQKENVSLSLATLDVIGDMGFAQVGSDSLIAIAVLEQYNKAKEELIKLDCDCSKHRMLKALFDIEEEETSKHTHTFVIDDLQDIPDILNQIIRGDFK